MEKKYLFKAVSEEDIDGIAGLEELCFAVPMSRDNLSRFLLGETGIAFVCYETKSAKIPCAYGGALLVFDETQILNIATHPEHRGRGLGKQITEMLIKRSREKGAAVCTLEVRESNSIARHLYEQLGFLEAGRIKNYYKKPTEDALILSVDITDFEGGTA